MSPCSSSSLKAPIDSIDAASNSTDSDSASENENESAEEPAVEAQDYSNEVSPLPVEETEVISRAGRKVHAVDKYAYYKQ